MFLLSLQYPAQLHKRPKFDLGAPICTDTFGTSFSRSCPSHVQFVYQNGLLCCSFRLPVEVLQDPDELCGVNVTTAVLIEALEHVMEVLNAVFGETCKLPLVVDQLLATAVHHNDKGIKVHAFRRQGLGHQAEHLRRFQTKLCQCVQYLTLGKTAAVLSCVPHGSIPGKLIFTMKSHEPQEFPEVQLPTVVGIHLLDEYMQVIQ
mmetsp:Transcript_26769/g.67344  ORF Transcript_26769/g.67344 Transcript_26769/m.67344 type:complete len:204 (-) Transcript_26769:576-1187(-)